MALALGTWNPTGHHFIHYISNVEDILSGFKTLWYPHHDGTLVYWLLSLSSRVLVSLAHSLLPLSSVHLSGDLQQYGIINVTEFEQAGWSATIGVGLLIWFGLNASIIWKKLTGVYTTDATVRRHLTYCET